MRNMGGLAAKSLFRKVSSLAKVFRELGDIRKVNP